MMANMEARISRSTAAKSTPLTSSRMIFASSDGREMMVGGMYSWLRSASLSPPQITSPPELPTSELIRSKWPAQKEGGGRGKWIGRGRT